MHAPEPRSQLQNLSTHQPENGQGEKTQASSKKPHHAPPPGSMSHCVGSSEIIEAPILSCVSSRKFVLRCSPLQIESQLRML
ncbi:hypothetical protein BC834DRAFT_902282 [Gloeopeniophorella convolvens]|nr:hypothetical protein BC834DRAFT_902282 [Gloeopeniophorella convolvens]